MLRKGLRIGCCGFPVSRDRYFKDFDVVELQQTFYQPPELRTIERWRDGSPRGFEYTIKAWQLITHEPSSPTYRRLKIRIPPSRMRCYGSFKPTDEVFEAFELIKQIADILGARIIVFQSPASFEPSTGNKENMKRFFSIIKRDGLILAWEPRGMWKDDEIRGLCKELDLVHVVDPFKAIQVHGRIQYYRLHGIGGYKYRYTEEDLKRLGSMIDAQRNTYIMFNNVHMYEDAISFKRLYRG
jgi:uncharacterized protein YecE (DUF72 family)